MKYNKMKTQLNQVFQQCLEKKLQPTEAVNTIDKLIGGITAAHFKLGKVFTITNNKTTYSLHYRNYRKKQQQLAIAVAYLAYQRAQQNGYVKCGEVHAGPFKSTKHHNTWRR